MAERESIPDQRREKYQRLRTTIFIETDNDADFEWALEHALQLARAHVIQMTFSKKGDPLTRYGVRTASVRKRATKG